MARLLHLKLEQKNYLRTIGLMQIKVIQLLRV